MGGRSWKRSAVMHFNSMNRDGKINAAVAAAKIELGGGS